MVVFVGSVRWGTMNAVHQTLMERLSWLENRHSTLGESNILKGKEAGIICTGQNWRGKEVVDTQKKVLEFYGFKTPEELSWNWQYTKDASDETQASYRQASKVFAEIFKLTQNIRESFQRFFRYINNHIMTTQDQTLLEQAYKNIRETAGAASEQQHSGQGPYRDAVDPKTGEKTGARTSNYLKAQPVMGKRDKLSDPQMQAGLAILQQYAQGDITSAVEVVEKFKDLYEKGVKQGPTQDDQYYTKLK